MSEVLQTNIFFFITSAAVVVLTILLVVVLVYVLLIVRNVKDVTDRVREGSELIASDLRGMRSRAGQIVGFIAEKFFMGKRRTRRSKSAKVEEST